MSASLPSKTSTFSFRSKSFWFICLFIIYSIFGWFIVPSIVESQLKENLKALANWEVNVSKVIFNPYTLSLKVSGANIQDQDELTIVRFDELFINFSLIETLSGTISFDEISLSEPFIHLDIDQDGVTNFQRAFISDTQEPESTPETEEGSGEIIDLFFDKIAIVSGKVHISDNSQGENFQLDLEPLTFSLEGFSTRNNDGGDYALSIALGNDQEINWHGQIGIAPFKSKGHLELNNIDSNSFWHYAKSASPYWLKQSRITLSGDYETAIHGDQTHLNIENSELTINDAVLSETSSSDSMLAFKSLNVAPISFDLAKLSLDLGNIELKQASISIVRSEDASLNILRPLNTQTDLSHEEQTQEAITEQASNQDENNSESKAETSNDSFHWNISGINISNSRVAWKDLTLSTPAEIGVNDIDLMIGNMSDDLSQAFPYDLSFNYMNPEPSNSANEVIKKQVIQGAISPLPFAIKGRAELANIELSSLQNYIGEYSHVTLTTGQLSFQSEYDLAMRETDSESILFGNILSSLAIDDVAVKDATLNKPLSGFKQLAVGPVGVSLVDDTTDINIEAVTLDQPYGDIFIAEDGRLNLSQLSKSSHEGVESELTESELTEDKTSSEPKQLESESNTSLSMLLKRFEIKQGQFTYTDASMTPTFKTQLSELTGAIENISTDSEAKSKVAFEGKIDSHGTLAVNGTLNPLSENPNTDIKVLASNIDLVMASPYAEKFAGYQIAKGKLDLDLSYLINDMQLTAKNQVLLNQFKFGKSVDSPDATSLPLPLAIGILKDRNGKIDLNLPISGDLNDPSFKITSVILNTFVNLITKVVTSPFSILGNLIEGSDDISDIQFMANSSELSPEQAEKITVLAKALKERPNLTLEIRGVADASTDKNNDNVRSEAELIQLAKDRALVMSKKVIEEGNIEAARVYVLEPQLINDPYSQSAETKETNKAPTISSKFTLGVR